LDATFEDFEILESNGQPVSAAQREQMKPVLDFASTLPALSVSKDGHYLGCEGLDEMVQRVTRLRGMTPDRAAQIRKVFSAPGMEATFQASVGMYWATWVESWIGWSLAPGTSKTEEQKQELGVEEVPAVVRQEFLEVRDGYATLRRTTTFAGEAAVHAISSLAGEVTKSLDVGPSGRPSRQVGTTENALEDARIEVTLYAETTATGLRPRRTRFDKTHQLVFADGRKEEGRELRELVWHWERAEGCKRLE
jgi:hypothetical protein